MEFHEVSNIFSMMNEDEFQILKTDIQNHGLRESIYTFEGKILDGRNRFNACQELGIKPTFEEWQGSFDKAIEFVWSENFSRRHLNSSQKAASAVEREGLMDVYREQAKERMLIGKQPNPTQLIAEGHKGEAAEQIAKATGTNRQDRICRYDT